jgi:hypothetical protein
MYEESYQKGLVAEKKVLPIVRKYFERDVKHITDRFSKYDFEDEEYCYELKSRTNRRESFPDTLIGLDKVENVGKKLILLFEFTDSLCFIEYDAEKFSKYEVVMFGRNDRNVKPKLHIKIPICDLHQIPTQ